MKVDQILDRINEGRKSRGEKILFFDSLTTEEKADIFKIAKESEAKELTVPDLIEHIKTLKRGVENELTNDKMESFSLWSFLFHWKKDYQLKARLRAYILFEEILTSPERIRKHAEQQLNSAIGG